MHSESANLRQDAILNCVKSHADISSFCRRRIVKEPHGRAMKWMNFGTSTAVWTWNFLTLDF